jgi:N-acetylmuramoyl-L-alanine amidase
MVKATRATRKLLPYVAALSVLLLGLIAFCVPSLVNTIHPIGIIIHHSAIPSLTSGKPIDIKLIDEIHRERGYGAFFWGRTYHIGYHYLILPDGTVQQGRPEHCRGAHAVGHNSYIGICLVGDFSTADNPRGDRGPVSPTDKQLDALTQLCVRLQEEYHIPADRIVRHNDVDPNTECPGDRFPFRQFLNTLVHTNKDVRGD